MNPDALIRFYQELSETRLAQFDTYYARDAYFKDPFNEVRGIEPIRRIFAHMFHQVAEPRFVITDRVVDDGGAMLVWELHYRSGRGQGGTPQCIRGATHLRFDAEGKVSYHRDYWDAAEELYMKLPLLGMLMRGLRRRLAA
jgi:steroid delta-isomerase